MRSSAAWSRWERVSNGSGLGIASVFRGLAGPAAMLYLPLRAREPVRAGALHRLSRSTAAMPSTPWPTRATAFRSRTAYSDVAAAPLLCAGLIGYRSLRMAGDARRLGIYGFGAAAHIIAQVARHQGREVFAFTRAGDAAAQEFARGLGAVWAGGSDEMPPEKLDAALIFAPVGALVPAALKAIVPGGTVVCGGIHMSDIPAFPYEWLWKERTSARSPTSPARMLRSSSRLRPKCRSRPKPIPSPSKGRTRRWMACDAERSRVRRFCCRAVEADQCMAVIVRVTVIAAAIGMHRRHLPASGGRLPRFGHGTLLCRPRMEGWAARQITFLSGIAPTASPFASKQQPTGHVGERGSEPPKM